MRKIPAEYLVDSSRNRLRDLFMKQINLSANRRKEIAAAMEAWAEERAFGMLAEWLMEHGEELIALISAPAAEVETPTERKEPDEAKPNLKRLVKYEHWRSAQRWARKRA